MAKVKLSERYRPDSEVAPWIHKEIVELEDRLEKLETWVEYLSTQAIELGKAGKIVLGEDDE